jgi:very-short-patch-repair endonuclease
MLAEFNELRVHQMEKGERYEGQQDAQVSKLEQELALQIAAAKLPTPTTQHRFHATRRWRADFAWPEHKVIVEVEGGIFAAGRHTRGIGFEKDCEKQNAAVVDGWKYLRVTGNQIKRGEALAWIQETLNRNLHDGESGETR